MNQTKKNISIILPARNEAASLPAILPKLADFPPETEIIVVDDGSTDATAEVAKNHGATVLSHPYPMGNGAAIKSGARIATGNILLFMDGDGQHRPEDIRLMLEKLEEGYDMVVGARGWGSQASHQRAMANGVFNRLASWMVSQKVVDLTSGFRVADAEKFRRFLYLLPNGFSYPTTITMSFFRAGYSVGYVPITTESRKGKSHVRPLRDGARFLIIIFKVGTLYSPLKLFLPISLGFFTTGMSYYLYTFITAHRFTNMTALLLTTSVLVFLIGLVSEQITTLNYRDSEK